MTTKKNRLQWENIRILPVLHNRMEFALEVRRQFKEFQPQRVAVEYPPTLREFILKGIARLPLLSAVYYQDADGSLVYLLLEPTDAQVEALRLAGEHHLEVHFVDRDTEGYPMERSPMPDSYAVRKIGHFLYCQSFLETARGERMAPPDRLREKSMAYHLQKLNGIGERVLFLCGLYHLPGLLRLLKQPQTEVIGRRRREKAGLAHLQEESSREVLEEMPFLIACYERFRTEDQGEEPDRVKILSHLVQEARRSHWKNNKELLAPPQLEVLHKFARNYALITDALVPNFYQLVVAARGAADDNFAYELWDKGSEYPWQTEDPGLPVIRLNGEDLLLDQKRIRFHRRLKAFRRRLVPVPVKKKIREKVPGEWKKRFHRFSICSYPPEDVVIEGYGRTLQEKVLRIKTEENSRMVPFVSSMMEGIDVRETIRNWLKGEIYVREGAPFRGKVGSIVVIFDPDMPDPQGKENYPWKVTWLGEHDQESDMAFYSTPAGEILEGPGISKCQHGGFMLTYPPLRVVDIWKDPYFDLARSKPERLLMAAIDYSLEKHVVYVAAMPPSGRCRSFAARQGKKIFYLPIGSFSPVTLKKIRQFHVLDGHEVRTYAKQYIR